MLIEFSVSNYRSIGDKLTLSLTSAPKQKEFEGNIIQMGNFSALNACALYGANASGKSNIIRAMSLMGALVHKSSNMPSTAKLPYDPFLLKRGYGENPTMMEIVFVANDKRYRYGFTYNKDVVLREWLYRKTVGREVALFLRDGEIIDVRAGLVGRKNLVDTAIDSTSENALFLSKCDAFNIEDAKIVMNWFDSFVIINGLYTEPHESQTVELWKQDGFQEKINAFLSKLSLGVQGIKISTKSFDENDLPQNITAEMRNSLISRFRGTESYNISAMHKVYSDNESDDAEIITWDFDKHESEGSKKTLHITGPILWTLTRGGVLVIDEIEAKLHPIMTLNAIDMFLDKNCNPKNAQLLFATHDTNLLSYSQLRRDQILFCEKNNWESTELYALSDFVYFNERNGKIVEEKERKDSDKERRYMEGRYGAIPMLGKFKESVAEMLWHAKEN